MAALRVIKSDVLLYDEFAFSPSILGKRRDHLYEFLSSRGISSLSQINCNTLEDYVFYTFRVFAFAPQAASSFKGDLETVYFNFMKSRSHPLTLIPLSKRPAIEKKALTYLMASRIRELSDISAQLRQDYENYLRLCLPSKVNEYVKILDKYKLSTITGSLRDPSYANKLLFLGYYPDPVIAEKLYFTAKKEFLFFDFSLPCAVLLKKQIFKILLSDLSRIHDGIRNHHLLQHYITPLYYLYDFCVEQNICDLKQVEEADIAAFNEYLTSKKASKSAIQVLNRARKFLFLSDERPDFSATAWFLERFHLGERINPARGSINFTFSDIDKADRAYFQSYMKYLFTLSPSYSFQAILEKYYCTKDFIKYLEKHHSRLEEISYDDIEGYIDYLDTSDIQPETYNRSLTMISFFLTVLSVRKKLLIPSFPFEYLYKKAKYLHHDRSVSEDVIDRIFTVLSDFPETVGLIFLTLYSTGIRINEVCTLKKDAPISYDGSCFLKVYQYKLHSEKLIPIPYELHRLLLRHIREDESGSIYVFPSCKDKDKPYRASTFVKQMKANLLMYEETCDIVFRSHDYRHTIATDLYNSGAKIATIRSFLGHNKEDMTKQYIDHLPGHIDELQEKYFKEHKNETLI